VSRYLFTEPAKADRSAILLYSRREHGDAGRRRYALLITAALRAAASDPGKLGSRPRPELGDGIYSYHLANARDKVPTPSDRVNSPRHFIVYRVDGNKITILRILHDAMDIPANFENGNVPK